MPENEKTKSPGQTEANFFEANFSSAEDGSRMRFNIHDLERVDNLRDRKVLEKFSNLMVKIDATESDGSILGELRRMSNQRIGFEIVELAIDDKGNKTYAMTILPSSLPTFAKFIKPVSFIATAPQTNAVMTNTVELVNLRRAK